MIREVNSREGLRRILIVLGTCWALYWIAVFTVALLHYVHSPVAMSQDALITGHTDSDARYDYVEDMLRAVFVGGVVPAVICLIGRYILRGFTKKAG